MKNNLFKITNTFLFISLIIIPGCKKKQTDKFWAKTYGGDGVSEGYSVQQTSDGGYIIAGSISSFDHNIYLIKTDANGDAVWTMTYKPANIKCAGYSVQPISDHGYIIVGEREVDGWQDYWDPWTGNRWKSYYHYNQGVLLKTNDNGKEIEVFTSTRKDRCLYSVQPTSDGCYIVTGQTEAEVMLFKCDANCYTVWEKTCGAGVGKSVKQTSDKGYIIAGYTNSFGAGGYDIYLIKTDENGDSLWTKTYGGRGDDYGNSVQQTTDRGYIVAGYTNSIGAGGSDVYLIKTDANGDIIWTKTYGGSNDDGGNSVQQTSDAGYIIAGWTHGGIYLIKTDAIGDTVWTKTYAGGKGNSVQQTSDGGYIIAGSYGGEVYLIKTDVNGDTIEPIPTE
jgi:hypothetical protein